MTSPISADGVSGMLLRGHNGTFVLRVYNEDKTFVDYDIHHSDLSVTINDKDAYFYQGRINVIDHSPTTLGIE